MATPEVIRLPDGRRISARAVREVLPLVPVDQLEAVHGRVSTLGREPKRAAIGETSDGQLALAAYYPANGWRPDGAGGWLHSHAPGQVFTDEQRAACRWIEGSPRLNWKADGAPKPQAKARKS